MEEKQYKPILVFYFEGDSPQERDFIDEAIKSREGFGYENIIVIMRPNIESRVEIVSVDKATVVEDIQKYIDLKII